MRCVGCGSTAVTERLERTAQGYKRFRCPRIRLLEATLRDALHPLEGTPIEAAA